MRGMEQVTAESSGTFMLGGELPVHRLGFGAMRITGEGIWGEPRDAAAARRVLRRAVDLGVTLIDTAEAYGPHVSERLIAEALYPYPEDLVIATKGGLDRPGPGQWKPDGRPERLREELEGSLRRLRVDCIDLWQLHRIDPDVPEDEQFGIMQEFQREGSVRLLGLSEADVDQIQRARHFFTVAAVQNRFNLEDREWEPVLDYCGGSGIAFLPWFPLKMGELPGQGGRLAALAARHGATPAQVALAWLLARSPVLLPIPGTSSEEHLEENVEAAGVELSEEEVEAL